MCQGTPLQASMSRAASQLAVLLLLFAALCALPEHTMARTTSEKAEAPAGRLSSPLTGQCTASPGKTSTDCLPGCQVCENPADSPDDPLPPRKRPCVCCSPGRRPHEANTAACKKVSVWSQSCVTAAQQLLYSTCVPSHAAAALPALRATACRSAMQHAKKLNIFGERCCSQCSALSMLPCHGWRVEASTYPRVGSSPRPSHPAP